MIWKSDDTDDKMPDLMLSGQKIFLRPPQDKDWGEWADVRGKNQMRLKPFEPAWPRNSLSSDFYKRRLARQTNDWLHDHGQYFLIMKAADASLIGGININHITRGAAQFASLGYWIDEAHEGQGFMKEALKLTLHHAFTTLQLNRMNAACIKENDRSKHLLLSSGFAAEGLAKNYLKINGYYQDHILFGLCAEDFKETYRLQS